MSSASSQRENLSIRVEIPAKLLPLLEGYKNGARDYSVKRRRYYIAHGGRDSAKSWTFGRALILLAIYDPLRILCVREIQRTIADSVHKLLADQIAALNAGSYFQVQDASITGRNKAEFLFAGLRGIDAAKIKSFEGVDIAWAEEAHAIIKRSWEILIPTIRAPESEIWATFNPDLDTDDTYQRFVVSPPDDAWVQKVTWEDNPWFSEVLDSHRLQLLRSDPEEYRHVYGGMPRLVVAGAIYAREVLDAIEKRRIRPTPYDPALPVHTIWDLGWNDAMTIILVQRLPSAVMVIGYIEDNFRTYAEYVAQLNDLHYVWGDDWLPHDGESKDPKAGKSGKQILEGLRRKVKIIPKLVVESGIKAARMMFPRTYFDDGPGIENGTGYVGVGRLLECLKRYRRAIPEKTGEPAAPVHDEYSHGADAFRGLATIVDQIRNDPRPRARPGSTYTPHDSAVGL